MAINGDNLNLQSDWLGNWLKGGAIYNRFPWPVALRLWVFKLSDFTSSLSPDSSRRSSYHQFSRNAGHAELCRTSASLTSHWRWTTFWNRL